MSTIIISDAFFLSKQNEYGQPCGFVVIKQRKSPPLYSMHGAVEYLKIIDKIDALSIPELTAVEDAIYNSRLLKIMPDIEKKWLFDLAEEISRRSHKRFTWSDYKEMLAIEGSY